jgi:uncharacterized protein
MSEQKTVKRRRIPVILRWILWVLLVQFVLINISSAFYAYRFTHFYTDPSLTQPQESGNIFSKTWKLFTGPRQPRAEITATPGFPYETIQLKTVKGLSIEGWYCAADSNAKGTIIIFHGIIMNKGRMLDEAYEFRSLGYNLLLIDFRGHGGSEGNKTTIGVREPEEVKAAYDYITQRGEKKIFLYGFSMGAVVVPKAVSEYQLQPAGVIIELPFLSLQGYLRGKARMHGFGAQQRAFAFLTTFWVGVENGFNGYKHETTRYVKNLTCPILMQYAGRDAFVLVDESTKIFDAIGSTDKKLVVYEQAQHESLVRYDPLRWRIEIGKFLREH